MGEGARRGRSGGIGSAFRSFRSFGGSLGARFVRSCVRVVGVRECGVLLGVFLFFAIRGWLLGVCVGASALSVSSGPREIVSSSRTRTQRAKQGPPRDRSSSDERRRPVILHLRASARKSLPASHHSHPSIQPADQLASQLSAARNFSLPMGAKNARGHWPLFWARRSPTARGTRTRPDTITREHT